MMDKKNVRRKYIHNVIQYWMCEVHKYTFSKKNHLVKQENFALQSRWEVWQLGDWVSPRRLYYKGPRLAFEGWRCTGSMGKGGQGGLQVG